MKDCVSAGVLNLYSLIYPLANFKSKIFLPNFFMSSLLQMPFVVHKSVNFCLQNFTPKAGQLYPWLRSSVLVFFSYNKIATLA